MINMTCDWEEIEEELIKPWKPLPELPEDILFIHAKRNPLIEKLIETLDLYLEY